MNLIDDPGFELDLKHICLVEDDDDARALIARVLVKDKYRVTGFENGSSFLKFMETTSDLPDLIILDYQLPDIKGIECLRRIKSNPTISHTSFIMLTGENTPEIIKSVYLAGAADYLLKPISSALLKERVKFNLTLKFEINKIYTLLNRLHVEQPSLLNSNGLKEFAKLESHCYPILYNDMSMCVIVSREYKPKFFISASVKMLKTHVKIFLRTNIRWNQVWPARGVPEKQVYDLDKNINEALSLDSITESKQITAAPELDSTRVSEDSKEHSNKEKNILPIITPEEQEELKNRSFGPVPLPNPIFWKSIFKWSEDKEACELEMQFWKNKTKILSKELGAKE